MICLGSPGGLFTIFPVDISNTLQTVWNSQVLAKSRKITSFPYYLCAGLCLLLTPSPPFFFFYNFQNLWDLTYFLKLVTNYRLPLEINDWNGWGKSELQILKGRNIEFLKFRIWSRQKPRILWKSELNCGWVRKAWQGKESNDLAKSEMSEKLGYLISPSTVSPRAFSLVDDLLSEAFLFYYLSSHSFPPS